MNYWMFSVHGPWNKEALIEKYKEEIDANGEQRSATYAAMVPRWMMRSGRY